MKLTLYIFLSAAGNKKDKIGDRHLLYFTLFTVTVWHKVEKAKSVHQLQMDLGKLVEQDSFSFAAYFEQNLFSANQKK